MVIRTDRGAAQGVRGAASAGARLLKSLLPFDRPEFLGSWQKSPPKPPAGAGDAPTPKGLLLGSYLTTMMTTHVNTADVARPLPEWLELGPSAHAPEGKHPIILTLGIQQNVRPSFLSFIPGMSYIECIVGVPDLRLKPSVSDDREPCAYLSRIELDRLVPMILGRIIGLPKRLSWIQSESVEISIRSFFGAAISDSEIRPYGPTGPAASFAGFEPIREMLRQPVVTRTWTGRLGYCYFFWEWDKCMMRSARGRMDALADLPCLPAGQYDWKGGFEDGSVGASWVHVPWVAAGPLKTRLPNPPQT